MSNYNKLQNVLNEVFQLDQADLDFGIYRIMNQKRDAINDFLQNSLPKQVKELLEKNLSGDAKGLKEELDKTIAQATALGADPNTLPKVKELKDKIASSASIETLEQEVFSHLANFFKRYYQGGDFISLRRYKKDVYAIPYEGEEVKLHWANHDQYYIKTSEYLKNYTFKLGGDKLVRFQLKEASTEQNNNKTQKDQERRFAIFEELPVEVDGTTLLINFTYELHKKTVKQDDLTKKAVEFIKVNLPVDFADVFALAATESNKQRTLLDKHLYRFVARHTFDYFIHKDLGGFLRRELDFYIKNEVLYIDDINTANEIAFNSQISKIKALKQVANKIILFLEQLENFQKKLWLKKKFVIAANYCITLDRIPADYYAEILENEAQLDEWKSLFDVSIKTIKELENEPFLVLDTKFFDDDFKDRLLTEFEDLDEQTNGLLINSENFQALNLLQERYNGQVNTCYIDPPYNTGSDDFSYKDNFKRSSWLSFIENRINLGKNIFKNNGIQFVSIDENEHKNLAVLLREKFENFISDTSIKVKAPSGVATGGFVFDVKENLLVYSLNSDVEPYQNKVEKEIVESGTNTAKAYNLLFENEGDEGEIVATMQLENAKIELIKHHNYKISTIPVNQRTKEVFFERFDSVFRTASMSGGIEKQIAKIIPDGELYSYYYTPSKGKNKGKRLKQYIYRNGMFLFLKDSSIKIEDGKKKFVIKLEQLSNIISKDLWQGIASEGKVTLKEGKKPEKLLKLILELSSEKNDLVLDYFLGSATTSAVSHKIGRKFIGIEMGSYFKNLSLIRMKHVLNGEQTGVSKEVNWKGGGCFKYMVLESYEDTLNNLILQQTQTQQSALKLNEKVHEEYLLQYMLDVESRDHLFNLGAFKNPFGYQLNVTENNELVPTTVDLVETFNYLIGLKVQKVERIKDFKLVTGENQKGDKILVIWRNLEKTTNDDLNRFVEKLDIKVFDGEFDIIYVNGDNNLANFKKEEESWKVRLIEEEFFNKMFDVKDI